jgi:hypothetical protein
MSQTTDKINALHAHIIASGLLDNDKLHAVLLLNGLREFYPQLQLTIQVTSSSPNFSTESMLKLSALTANSMHQQKGTCLHMYLLCLNVPY